MRRLQTRLVVATAAVAAATMTLLVIGLQILLAHSTTNDSISLLRARADAASATIEVRSGQLIVLDSYNDSLDQNLWVYDAAGRLVDGPRLTGKVASGVTELSTSTVVRTTVVGERHRLLAKPVVKGGKRVGVVVAGLDLKPYENTERRSLWYSLALGVLAVLAAAAAASAATRYSLAKVRDLAPTADDWREHDLRSRFALDGPADELTELGATLNRMLERIEHTILAERRLTDEVAHELRTPLTTIRSEAELARQQGAPEEAVDAIIQAAERMSQSITTMLSVARAATGRDTCVVADVLELAGRNGPERAGVAIHVVPASLVVDAPAQVVVAALGPLLDNAVRHARSTVQLSAQATGDRVLVTVDDDGPGVHPDDAGHIFDSGFTTGGGGAGLGLALARRLAHSVGAEVRVQCLGHGSFVLDLPRP